VVAHGANGLGYRGSDLVPWPDAECPALRQIRQLSEVQGMAERVGSMPVRDPNLKSQRSWLLLARTP
jgi:hypothetical protein